MCVSGVVKLVFSISLLIGLVALVASILTPWWRHFDVRTEGGEAVKGKDFSLGILSILCGPGVKSGDPDIYKQCKSNFMGKEAWEQTTVLCMLGAVGACVVALVWNCVFCFACCCDSCLTPPLPILSGLGAILSAIAVVVYAVCAKEQPFDKPPTWETLTVGTDLGVSLWLAVGGSGCLVIATIAGIALVRIQKSPLGSVI